MDWPPHSPDLNPIKNLQALLKAKIYELQPDLIHMGNNDESKAILLATAQQAWDKLDIRYLQHLSETMPHRVEAIIESQGWYTPYQIVENKEVLTGRILVTNGVWGKGVLKLLRSHCTYCMNTNICYNTYITYRLLHTACSCRSELQKSFFLLQER